MRLRLLSRASALAVLQAELVARALRERWPGMDVTLATRSSEGDRDRQLDLWTAADKGVFTADLSDLVAAGDADAAVHSWKDLPIESHAGTRVAATLERADPRDVLLVRRSAAQARGPSLTVLSSSPRRAWQVQTSAARLLPWPVSEIRIAPIRGNVPTRLAKLVAGDGDALVVAKAALDRLLAADAPAATAESVRSALDRCRWMVLPLKEHPTAPAQGALAVEIAAQREDVLEWIRAISHQPTWDAVERERAILQSYGGGCHEAVGATVLVREYGRVVSIRAKGADQAETAEWSLETTMPVPPPAPRGSVWPRPEERDFARRRALDVPLPAGVDGFWIARADALRVGEQPGEEQLVWAAGSRTWERLADRGVWVNGCADGLGDAELPGVDLLAGHSIRWTKLTHADSGDPDAVATYVVDQDFPQDFAARTHFFWTSGSAFLKAVARYPPVRNGWHASGPGRTACVIRENLGTSDHVSVWLDYDQWLHRVTS